MIARQEVIEEARRWIKTPFAHQGRRLGVGVDCVGLVIGIAKNLGISDYDARDYGRVPDGKTLQARMEERLVRIPAPQPGAIGLFRWTKSPQHVGVFSDYGGIGLIHAYERVGKCVETAFDDIWRRRLVACYQFPEVM